MNPKRGVEPESREAGARKSELINRSNGAFLLLLALWILIRVIPAAEVVFPGGESPTLLGNDPWFHFHQSRASVEHFPGIHRWDVSSFYPQGSYASAAGLFNLLIAAVSILFGGADPPDSLILSVLAWSPIVLGALSLWGLYMLGKSVDSAVLGLVAVLVRIVFPGTELERTMLGFGDYHVAELLFATLSILLLYRFVRLDAASPSKVWGSALLCALPLAMFQFVWFGGFLHVGTILVTYWIVFYVSSFRSGVPDAAFLRRVPYFMALALIIFSIGALFPDWIMSSRNHWLSLQLLLGHCLCSVLLMVALPVLVRRLGGRFSNCAILGAGVLSVVVVVLVSERVRGLFGQLFAKRSGFVSEHYDVNVGFLVENYGLLFVLVPFGLFYMYQKSKGSPGSLLTPVYIFIWFVIWWVSRDFGYIVFGLLPLLIACGFLFFCRSSSSVSVRFRKPATVFTSVVVALSLLFVWPLGITKRPLLSHQHIKGMVSATLPWRKAMKWVREETPELPISATHLSGGWNRRKGFSYPEGAYGILSHWQYGNLIPALGDRFAVSARARSGRFMDWFLKQTEEESRMQLAEHGNVKYVILDAISVTDSFPGEILQAGRDFEDIQVADGSFLSELGDIPLLSFGEDFRKSIGARLYLGDGSGMTGYRLVYESPFPSFLRYRMIPELEAVELRSTLIEGPEMLEEAIPLTEIGESWFEGECFCYSGDLVPSIKIFECVPGAVISGMVPGNSPVTLELELECRMTERSFVFSQSATPGENGRVRFVVPYPTEVEKENQVRATGPYLILQGEEKLADVQVAEEAVHTGQTVEF